MSFSLHNHPTLKLGTHKLSKHHHKHHYHQDKYDYVNETPNNRPNLLPNPMGASWGNLYKHYDMPRYEGLITNPFFPMPFVPAGFQQGNTEYYATGYAPRDPKAFSAFNQRTERPVR